MYLLRYFKDFTGLFFPEICCGCGNHLLTNEEILCTSCRVKLPRTRFHNDLENPVAKVFWGRVYLEFATSFLYFSKGGIVQHMLHQLKYREKKEVGLLLGNMFGQELKEIEKIKSVDCIVPVPLYWKKQKQRGYNQSEMIATGIAQTLSISVDNLSLVRNVASSTQTKKSRFQRWENVKTIFQLKNPEKFAGKHILLVDDVVTTGATLEACANEFLKHGNTKVSVAALAMA